MLASMIRLLAGLLAALMISAPNSVLAQPTWDHVARVVVIGDLHGDYGKFHDMLREAGLINARDNWSGGATHLEIGRASCRERVCHNV